MNYLEHRGRRVNLSTVLGYESIDHNEIAFLTGGEPIIWSFDGKAKRNATMNALDEQVSLKKLDLSAGLSGDTLAARFIKASNKGDSERDDYLNIDVAEVEYHAESE